MNESAEAIADQADVRSEAEYAVWKDLFGFLVGKRRSILRLIHAEKGWWLAGTLVFAAALAREYDAVSLLHRPWELLGSFAASLALCTGLFLWVWFCLALRRRKLESPGNAFASFLTGYWLTAPLAWIYAIPIETMGDEITALKFNLTALSIVSVWRVALFARVVSVQFRLHYWISLLWILLPCMLVACAALVKAIMPMVAIMGGLRLTQTQEILRDFQSNVLGILFYAILPVFIAWCSTFALSREETKANAHQRTFHASKGLWSVAIMAVLVLLVAASFFQPDLWRSAKVDRLLLRGEFESAIAFMTAQGEDQFPINWDPPPRFPYGDARRPDVLELAQTLLDTKPRKWIVDRLLAQTDEILLRRFGWSQGSLDLTYVSEQISNLDLETLEKIHAAVAAIVALEVGDVREQTHHAELQQAIEKGIENYHKRVEYELEVEQQVAEDASAVK